MDVRFQGNNGHTSAFMALRGLRRRRRSCPLSPSPKAANKKTKKNTDLWEENCHSGTTEKAEEIFIPPPQGGPHNFKMTCAFLILPQGHRRGGGHAASSPTRGRSRGNASNGTKECRLRRRRSPIGHSNRLNFISRKISNLCVLSPIVESN